MGCLYPDVPTRGTDAVGGALGKGPGQSEVPHGGPEKQQELDPCPVSGQTALGLGFVMGTGTPWHKQPTPRHNQSHGSGQRKPRKA